MELFAEWCGFLGSWLLVAGPIYQAALELREEDMVRSERINETRTKYIPPRQASAWWWFLPPVKLYLERRRTQKYFKAFLAALPEEDIAALVSFKNKANGWLFVAGGGLLLAVNETYGLTRALHLKLFVFWIAIIVFAAASVAYTAYSTAKSERTAKKYSEKTTPLT